MTNKTNRTMRARGLEEEVDLKILFQAFSNLTSINIDFVNSLIARGLEVHVIPELWLAKLTLMKERMLGDYRAHLSFVDLTSKVFPRATLRYFSRFDLIHLTGLTEFMLKAVKNVDRPTVLTLGAGCWRPEYETILDRVTVVIAPSKFVLNRVVKASSIPLKHKVRVIPWGVNTSLFNSSIPKEYARRSLKLPENSKVIFWNSRISPEKDAITLIEAAKLVVKEVKEVLFYIKGRGVNRAYWRRIKDDMKELAKRGKLKLHIGWTNHRKLPLFYRASDLFVHTSTLEAFGLVFLES